MKIYLISIFEDYGTRVVAVVHETEEEAIAFCKSKYKISNGSILLEESCDLRVGNSLEVYVPQDP